MASPLNYRSHNCENCILKPFASHPASPLTDLSFFMRLFFLFLVLFTCNQSLFARTNVALNKPYVLSHEANYPYCKDDGDATDLTDGRKHDPKGSTLWTQKRAVGWAIGEQFKTIDIDLQSQYDITGVTFQTAASAITQGTFPLSVMVFVSHDNKNFRYAGELINEPIDQHNYVVHTFTLSDLDAEGRYVRLLTIRGGFYVFCTEIEVFGSPSEEVKPGDGMSKEATLDFAKERLPALRQYNSSLVLLGIARDHIQSFADDHPRATAKAFDTLGVIEQSLQQKAMPDEVDFRRGVPFTSLDAQTCAVVGRLYQAIDLPAISLSQTNPWEPRQPFNNQSTPPSKRLKTLHGEWAEMAFNITNGTDETQTLSLAIEGLPPDAITTHQAIFVEAFGFRLRSDALLPITNQITIAPGLTSQIWLSIDTRQLTPGVHSGQLTIAESENRKTAPVELEVSTISFPEETVLDINVFGYMHWPIAKADSGGTSLDMQKHYVNNHVIVSSYLPIPRVNAAGDSIGPMDFTMLDDYIAKLPHARRFTLFMGFEWDYRKMYPKQDEPKREKIFRQWLRETIDHLKQKGLSYDQFNFLWVDEPSQKVIEEIVAPCTRVLREVDPDAQVWIDITGDVTEESLLAHNDLADIWCPASDKVDWAFWKDKEYWYYDSASDKSKSPTAHYRHKLWKAFAVGATGNAFWTYMDGSDPWDDYAGSPSYGVVYNTAEGKIATGKRWEAYRAGIEDYELCHMLTRAIENAKDSGKGESAAVINAKGKLQHYLDNLDTLRNDHSWAERAHMELIDHLELLSK